MSEAHLGGNFGVTHVDDGALIWAKDKYGAKSMLDIGCGVGDQTKLAVTAGYARATGIDGDKPSIDIALKKNAGPNVGYICHDFCNDPAVFPGQFDLIWCVEFLEHVYEKYLPNVFQVIVDVAPTVMICTAASVGQPGGVHHVNCRERKYWVEQMAIRGLRYDQEATEDMKKHSTMQREFMRNTGMVFIVDQE